MEGKSLINRLPIKEAIGGDHRTGSEKKTDPNNLIQSCRYTQQPLQENQEPISRNWKRCLKLGGDGRQHQLQLVRSRSTTHTLSYSMYCTYVECGASPCPHPSRKRPRSPPLGSTKPKLYCKEPRPLSIVFFLPFLLLSTLPVRGKPSFNRWTELHDASSACSDPITVLVY